MIWLTRDGAWFCVDIPRENIPPGVSPERIFPYGVMLVEYVAEDGHIAGHVLLPVYVNSRDHYSGRVRVAQITTTARPDLNRFRWTHVGLEDEEVIAQIDAEEVRKLLELDVVLMHDDARNGVSALLRRIERGE